MIEKRVPLRTCVFCRTEMPKKQLLRIVKSSQGEINLDLTGKMSGRGAYVCGEEECLKKMEKQGLSRVFKCEVKQEVSRKILEDIILAKQQN